ncbi:hypothetical protein [Pseudomonas sp. VA159-2]|uniref:hypothetical protein n=2 Tax=unclassified Pseudomonas TaxID=196821 RepID=UPI0020971295|nr:hypothetical protein [Pseudomonas sp. VA159-2]MCO7542870.1 hypothetical protein [Pseudomonas sp. VA159-2]
MNYLKCNVLELCMNYLMGASSIKAETFGLRAFGEAELKTENFDMVGDADDFCLYEKDYLAVHFLRSVDVTLKRYFFNGRESGCGISLSPGVRLVPLLKRIISRGLSVEFYLHEGALDGAVVVGGNSIVRFSANRSGTAYEVRDLESDQLLNNEGTAVNSIRKSMSRILVTATQDRGKVVALHRLLTYLRRRDVLQP